MRADNGLLGAALGGAAGRAEGARGRDRLHHADAFNRKIADGAGHRAAVEAALRAVCGTALQVRYELHEIAPTEQPPAPSEDEIVARFVAEFDAEEIVPEPEERKEGEA